jgi:hypothetical protein
VPPLVTVITATYNCAALLRCSLGSLVAQTHSDFEAWVVGDGCTDDSADVVASFRDTRLRWYNLGANSGSQAAPNNEGLRRATGTWVAYLGHDDLWLPWHLETLVGVAASSRAEFAHALLATFDLEGPCGASGPPAEGRTYATHFVPPSAWLTRRAATAQWGPWADPNALPRAVDEDYGRRAALAGATFAFSPRLGVLKFPSSAFHAYARPKGPPAQEAYLQQMRVSPEAVERDVLNQLAIALARHPQAVLSRVRTETELVRQTARSFIRRYGLEPLRDQPLTRGALVRWFQRQRRKSRVKRGLPL